MPSMPEVKEVDDEVIVIRDANVEATGEVTETMLSLCTLATQRTRMRVVNLTVVGDERCGVVTTVWIQYRRCLSLKPAWKAEALFAGP